MNSPVTWRDMLLMVVGSAVLSCVLFGTFQLYMSRQDSNCLRANPTAATCMWLPRDAECSCRDATGRFVVAKELTP